MLMFHQLNGLGAASNPGVAELQQALTRLAHSTGVPAMNPGSVDGVMAPATMSALAASFDLISPELPFGTSTAVQAAFMIGAQTAAATSVVTQYAIAIAGAVDAANTKWMSQHGGATPGMMPVVATPWYQTPVGIVGIVVGGFVAYKVFFKVELELAESGCLMLMYRGLNGPGLADSGWYDFIFGGDTSQPAATPSQAAVAPPADPSTYDSSGDGWFDFSGVSNAISNGYDSAANSWNGAVTSSQQQAAADAASSAAWQTTAAAALNIVSNALYPKPKTGPTVPVTVTVPPAPWYSTPLGMVAIAAAAVGGIYYLAKK